LGAGRQIQCFENEVQAHAAVLGRDRAHVAAAEKAREFLFKCGDVRALNQLSLLPALADNLRSLRHHAGAEPSDSHRRSLCWLVDSGTNTSHDCTSAKFCRSASCVIVCSARNRTRKSDHRISSEKCSEIAWPDNCRIAELEEPMRLQFRAISILALGITVLFEVPAHAQDASVYVCISTQGGLRMVGATDTCKNNETRFRWTIAGPQGPAGPQGAQGPAGPQGPQGAAG